MERVRRRRAESGRTFTEVGPQKFHQRQRNTFEKDIYDKQISEIQRPEVQQEKEQARKRASRPDG
jgi:hypothetical protein